MFDFIDTEKLTSYIYSTFIGFCIDIKEENIKVLLVCLKQLKSLILAILKMELLSITTLVIWLYGKAKKYDC